eukprot:gene17333-19065_t
MYRFVRGSGNNKVYNVRQKETGERLVMHVIEKEDCSVTSQDSLLQTKSFRIPFLTSLRYSFRTKSRNYLVLDSADTDRQLSNYFHSHGPLDLDEVVFIAAEIVTAISHLHVCCATYKHLRLENVLIDSSGHVQLTRDIFDSSQWAQLECFLCDGKRASCAYHYSVTAEQDNVAKDWKDIGKLVCLLLTGKKTLADEDSANSRLQTQDSRYSHTQLLPTTLWQVAADFIQALLHWDKNPIPTALTQSHEFFASVDWDKVCKRQATPPRRLISFGHQLPSTPPIPEPLKSQSTYPHASIISTSSPASYKTSDNAEKYSRTLSSDNEDFIRDKSNKSSAHYDHDEFILKNREFLRDFRTAHIDYDDVDEDKLLPQQSTPDLSADPRRDGIYDCPDDVVFVTAEALEESWRKRRLQCQTTVARIETREVDDYSVGRQSDIFYSDDAKRDLTTEKGSSVEFNNNTLIYGQGIGTGQSDTRMHPTNLDSSSIAEVDRQVPTTETWSIAKQQENKSNWQLNRDDYECKLYSDGNGRHGSLISIDSVSELGDMDHGTTDRRRKDLIPIERDYVNENASYVETISNVNDVNNIETLSSNHRSKTKISGNNLAAESGSVKMPGFRRSHSYNGGFVNESDNDESNGLSVLERANKLLQSNFVDWRERPTMSSSVDESSFDDGDVIDGRGLVVNSSTDDIKASVEKARSLHKRLSLSLQNIRTRDTKTTTSRIPLSIGNARDNGSGNQSVRRPLQNCEDEDVDDNSFMTEYLNSSWPNRDFEKEGKEQDALKRTWPILLPSVTKTERSSECSFARPKVASDFDQRRNSPLLMQKISDGEALQKIKQGAYLQGNKHFRKPQTRRGSCDAKLAVEISTREPSLNSSAQNAKSPRERGHLAMKKFDHGEAVSAKGAANETCSVSKYDDSCNKMRRQMVMQQGRSENKFVNALKPTLNAGTGDARTSSMDPSMGQRVPEPRRFSSPTVSGQSGGTENRRSWKKFQVVAEDEIKPVSKDDVFLPNPAALDCLEVIAGNVTDLNSVADVSNVTDVNNVEEVISFAGTNVESVSQGEAKRRRSSKKALACLETPSIACEEKPCIQNIAKNSQNAQSDDLTRRNSKEHALRIKEGNCSDRIKDNKQVFDKRKKIPRGTEKTMKLKPVLKKSESFDSVLQNICADGVLNKNSKEKHDKIVADKRNGGMKCVTANNETGNQGTCGNGKAGNSLETKEISTVDTTTGVISRIPIARKSLSTGAISVRRPDASKSPGITESGKMKVLLSPRTTRSLKIAKGQQEEKKDQNNNNYIEKSGSATIGKVPSTVARTAPGVDANDLIGKLKVLSDGCMSGRTSPLMERKFFDMHGEGEGMDRENSVRRILQPLIMIQKATPDQLSLASTPSSAMSSERTNARSGIVSRESSIGSASDLMLEEDDRLPMFRGNVKRKHCVRTSSANSGKSIDSLRTVNVTSPTLTAYSSEEDASLQARELDRASFNSARSTDSGLSDIYELTPEDIKQQSIDSCDSQRGKAVAKSDSGVMKDIEDGGAATPTESNNDSSQSNSQENLPNCMVCQKGFEPDQKSSSVHSICKKCSSKKVERKEAIVELIQTEINYGQDLRILKEEFYTPIKNGGILSPENSTAVFLNLQELIDVNSKLCITLQNDLEECIVKNDQELASLNVGKVFLDNVEFFQAYEIFCAKQRQALELVESLKKKLELFKIFLQVSSKQNSKLRKLDLQSFLAMPVQRIMKYPLLLTRIYHATPRSSADREALLSARRKIEEQITRINEIAIGRPAKMRKCKSMSALNQATSSAGTGDHNHMKKLAAEILNWKHEETLVIMSGNLEVSLGELIGVANWSRKSMKKTSSVTTMLCAQGHVDLVNWSTETGLDQSVVSPVKGEVTNAAIILLKRKSTSRFSLFKEPILLGEAVIAQKQDVKIAFEVCPIMKEPFTFLTVDQRSCENWLRNLNYFAKHRGMWRRRRNAMANIMIKSMS